MEALEPRMLLAVDPVGGMVITADTEFNAGTFVIDGPITIATNNVTVTGAGQGVTVIEVDPADTTGFNVFEIHNRNHVIVQDLSIDGNDTSHNSWLWFPLARRR